ncbi:hypothetical protein QJS04_geneDACA018396 [Acorus gramineus]|uniref:VASt domain-containing protein n=1 Tax=Acorus gramineus TaxID=55184 RepID=A0AAV9ACQ6_ACOGR|nr:hypothetical protein QJS04_geneDACA018396 [Acorus gramineus]
MAVASPIMEDSIHSSPSAAKLDADTASETSSAGGSDRNYQSDSSVQRRRDIEPQTISRSEEYRLLFHLPPEEFLIQDFNCALQENILLQGHMYLFMHHICFYSNIFGFETKKVIHFFEVTCVRKAKTAAIFPNAIEMVAGGKKIFFASFLSRDEAYRLIVDGWSQHNSDVKVSPDNQELKSETESMDSVPVLFERSKVSKETTNEVFLEDRNKDIQISEQCKALPNGETDFGRSINLSPQENGEEEIVNCSSPGELLNWEPEDVVAPRVPEYYTPVAESKFRVSVEDFFSLFLSDADFIGKFHRRCGDKDFKCSSWYKHEQSGNARDLSFQHPVKIYFGARYGHCEEVQRFRVYRNSHLVVETLQNVSDVPYADYFCVEGIWDVEEDISEEGSCCMLRVYTNVAFSKKTMWKGKIEQSTIEECREAYAVWINMAHEILKEKKLSKLKGISGHAADLVQDTDVTLNSYVVVDGPSLRTHSMKKSPRNPRSDSVDLVSQFEDPAGIGLGTVTSIVTFFRGQWARLCSYWKDQSHSSLILIVAFLFVVLMQLSIIVLLTRTPEINIEVPRENSFSSDRSEAVAWLEKRVYHLKEDMLMVESRLEIMRREYALLRDHLQAL